MSQSASAPSERQTPAFAAWRVLVHVAFLAWIGFVSLASMALNYPSIADPIALRIGVTQEEMAALRTPFKQPSIYQ